jgi:hypothetical protein
MNVEVTCRYCHRPLKNQRLVTGEVWVFECIPCQSQQAFLSNGQCTYWLFRVGYYSLNFDPFTQKFKIIRLPSLKDPGLLAQTILQLDYLPHNLTPKTCTEERIKTLILFS